jgi:FGGY-family pentulose kinase
MSSERYVIGIDVGTGSARAGIFDANGKMLASASEPIEMWKPKPDYAEQSSENIWRAICKVVRACRETANVDAQHVAGISYDATCSLVAFDIVGQPLAVNDEGDNNRNIIVWMDHRALAETEEINAGKHEVLKYVGGRLSPEMETPKLRWLKTHLPQTWERAGKFFDLADFLTYRSTGIDARSLCTVVCKWTYLGHEGNGGKWDRKFFKKIGLSDLFEGDKIGSDMRPMGSKLGPLTLQSAAELGLTTNCVVGVGIIDAHAGGLGLLGAIWEGKEKIELQQLESALALIGGTSNCHMAVSREPRFIDGVWGPYWSAMVPGMWLTEGGQSTAGSAIDHVISDHANAAALTARSTKEKKTVYELLNMEIARLQAADSDASTHGAQVTKDVHVLPYFLGNRSPHADPHAHAIVDGLSLDQSLTSQALLYYATIQAVAYGTRDIIAAMNDVGYNIDTMFVTGGGTKNPLWLQETADATGTTLVLPQEQEAVLLGSAILAATAAGIHPDIYRAMQSMSHAGKTVKPRKETAAYHKVKFKIFRSMYKEQKRRRSAMAKF